MIKIKSVEIYSNDDNERVSPSEATKRDIFIMDGLEIAEHSTEWGTWKSSSKEHMVIKYDDELDMEVVTEADFKEEEHPRGGSNNSGQFTSKGGSGTKKTKDKKEKKGKEPKEKKPIKKQKLTQNADPRKLKMFEDIKKHFGDKDWKELCGKLGILPLGISVQELNLMRYMARKKATRLTELAAITGLSKGAIQKDYELYLSKMGLMEIQPEGRSLTTKGLEYLNELDGVKKDKSDKASKK